MTHMPFTARAPENTVKGHLMNAPAGRGPGSGWLPVPGQVEPAPHQCPVGGCQQDVRADRLMCRPHWYTVPKPLRDIVWATWRSGEAASSIEHMAAIRVAIAAVDEVEHLVPFGANAEADQLVGAEV